MQRRLVKFFDSLFLNWLLLFLPIALIVTITLLVSPASALPPIEMPVNPTPLIMTPATPVITCQIQSCGDLGDAPELGMTAYPFTTTPVITASFPTIYDPHFLSGPFHQSPDDGPTLGFYATSEKNAHQLPDEDGDVTNIDPVNDIADRDGGDDGLFNIKSLADCFHNPVPINIVVPTTYTGTIYLNSWFDYNRDGDWQDNGRCNEQSISEWVIQNQTLSLPPGSHTITVTVGAFHPVGMGEDEFPPPIWMRITVSEQPAPLLSNGGSDGRGPLGGYLYGETEDYYLQYYEGGGCPGCAGLAGWQG